MTAILIRISRRLSIFSRPRRQFAGTATRAGLFSQVSSTTWARCSAFMANLNGPWWATHFRSAAPIRTRLFFLSFSPRIPTAHVPEYQTKYGIYEPNCGLDNVHLSWGHDEYHYSVTKNYLPEPAQYMLRYHSFYAAHKHGAYGHLMNQHDVEMFEWVRKFNPYDLYSKGSDRPSLKESSLITTI